MVRGVLKDNGMIQPLDPLPPEWIAGHEVRIDEFDEAEFTPEELQKWFADLDELGKGIDPEDWDRMDQAIKEIRLQGKEETRRQMGLK